MIAAVVQIAGILLWAFVVLLGASIALAVGARLTQPDDDPVPSVVVMIFLILFALACLLQVIA